MVGVSPFRDRAMYICAHWLLYDVTAAVLIWAGLFLYPKGDETFLLFLAFLSISLSIALVASYGIALLWRHPRPAAEFPKIKSLLTPLQVWKSFPSDHTIVVFVLALSTALFGASSLFVAILFACGLLVAAGRIYVGVHYPRDILGGLTIAILCVLTARYLVL